MSSTEVPTGHLGNLTAEQEAKLRELWILTLKVFGVDLGELDKVVPKPTTPESPTQEKKKPKRSMFGGFFGYKEETEPNNSGSDTGSHDALSTSISNVQISDGDDKYGASRQFQNVVGEVPAEEMRETFWNMVKHNDPDSLLLRFLRARKWDVKKALIMFITTIHWRSREAHVDDDVMKNGEGLAFRQLKSNNPKEKKAAEEFLYQLRLGKNYFRGFDKVGRPICVIRVRKHKANDQSVEVMERYTVYTIELARLMLVEPVENATIIFDMTNFTLANMDYVPVKLMIKCFEANYPECLGAILIHKAPWIFSGIWNIIKGWLDPVVASKVHFTNNDKDLEQFIPRDRIVRELEGGDNWEYEYVEPNEEENHLMNDTATRDSLVAKRQALAKELENSTIAWIASSIKKDDDAKASAEQERKKITKELNNQYWVLDPYIRARSAYDRMGIIASNGSVEFYPDRKANKTKSEAEFPGSNSNADQIERKVASQTETETVAVKDETAP